MPVATPNTIAGDLIATLSNYKQGDLSELDLARFRREADKLTKTDLVSAFVVRGIIEYLSSNFEEAIANHEKAIEIEPYNDTHYTNLALTLLLMGNVDRALAEYANAVEISPGNLDLLVGEIEWLIKSGEFSKAFERIDGPLTKLSVDATKKYSQTKKNIEILRSTPNFDEDIISAISKIAFSFTINHSIDSHYGYMDEIIEDPETRKVILFRRFMVQNLTPEKATDLNFQLIEEIESKVENLGTDIFTIAMATWGEQ